MRILILYGSQTGTAQDVAEQIWRESKQFPLVGPVMSMDDYSIENLIKEKLVVFVASTTGNGDEPDNMKKCWKFLLRKSLPTNSLLGLKFACIGLGDSSYAKYNFTAKKLNKRLIQLSATPLIPLGLCDDQHDHGFAATLLPWKENLWAKVGEMYPDWKRAAPANICTKLHVGVSEKLPCAALDNLKWPLKVTPIPFQIVKNVRRTSENHFQDVRLIQMKFPVGATWNPGDILDIRPWNEDEKVDELFSILKEGNLGFDRNTVVEFQQLYEEMPLPIHYQAPVTLEMLAKYVWDLTAVPRPSVFGLLALNCHDELEKDKLIEFTTPEGLEDLIAYANRPRRSLLEVLNDFPHATSALTLNILFEIFPIIRPRSFSIASVPETGTLDLYVAVVEYKTKLSRPRRGLCSNWLKDLKDDAGILGIIKKGTMKIPNDISTPIIMVGPGTGIAPFLSILLQHENKSVGSKELVVFFGCRYKEKDFFCRDDFERAGEKGIAKCFTAFSRDQESKVYVQHLIKENALLLKDLITNKKALILVAGSSNNMPKAVKEAFLDVIEDEAYLEKMLKTNQYQEETWS